MKIRLALALVCLVATPVLANLVNNGSFEDNGGSTAGWTDAANSMGIDNTVPAWNPPDGGSHWAGASGGSPIRTYQEVDVTSIPGDVDFSGWFSAGGFTWGGWEGGVQIYDGDFATGTLITEWRENNTQTAEMNVTWSGPVPSGTLTIVMDITFANGGGLNFDAFEVTPEPTSLALLGLAGMPLIMRRRRR